MALSSDLISQFVQVTKDDKTKKETTVYGTIVEYEGNKYVRLDGSELLTTSSSNFKYKTDYDIERIKRADANSFTFESYTYLKL